MSGKISVQLAKELSDTDPAFEQVWIDRGRICADLSDGRAVSIPLSWSWRLEAATTFERSHVIVGPGGYTAEWPAVDEGFSPASFLRGQPAKRLGSDREANILREARSDFMQQMQVAMTVAPVSTETLRRAKPLLNIAALAREAGMNPSSLSTKLDRGSALTSAEAQALHGVLVQLVDLVRQAKADPEPTF